VFDDVAEFHQKILGQPSSESPSLVTPAVMFGRFKFLQEEIDEFITAAFEGDIVGATDGLLDLIYVAAGTLYIMGIPAQACWDVVQSANMRKVRGTTKRKQEFDAVKPEGWLPPEPLIAKIIGDAIK